MLSTKPHTDDVKLPVAFDLIIWTLLILLASSQWVFIYLGNVFLLRIATVFVMFFVSYHIASMRLHFPTNQVKGIQYAVIFSCCIFVCQLAALIYFVSEIDKGDASTTNVLNAILFICSISICGYHVLHINLECLKFN